MKAGGGIGPGGGRIRRAGGITEAAQARRGRAKFLPSFAALQEAVRSACATPPEWEAKVCAGIAAVLKFAAAEPEATLTLTVRAQRGENGQGGRQDEVLAYFAELLDRVTPEQRVAISTNRGIVNAIATIIRGHLRAGSAAELPAQAPELAYMALMPYTGLEGARPWAEALVVR